jgi:hypothetical protein
LADPVVHITNGVPDLGTGNITTLGQTLLDGANIVLGATADLAVGAGGAGTINAHLRSISRDIAGGIVLQAGGNAIGSVGQSGGPWTQNITQFGGAAIVTGTGVSGAGIPRVTVSSDTVIGASQSGTWNINNISGTISLPTGAATSAKQPNFGTGGVPSADVLSVQGISTGTALKVDGTGGSFPVSGAVTVTSGSIVVTQSTPANLKGQVDPLTIGTWGLSPATQNTASPTNDMLVAGQFNTSPATITTGNSSPLQLDSGANLLVSSKPRPSGTGTQTSVAASVTNVTLLAANANRLGATIYNDDTAANIFVLLSSGSASTTAFTVKLVPGAYYELPFRYTGAIQGIWSVATGAARVTELT